MDPSTTVSHTTNDYLIGSDLARASATSIATSSYPQVHSSTAPTTTNSTTRSTSPSSSLLAAATSTTKLLSDVDKLMSATGRNRRIAQSAGAALYPTASNGSGGSGGADDDNDDDYDTLHGVIIDAVHSSEPTEPTSAMLHFCKHRFLRPFVQLLGCCGLRPMSAEASDWSFWSGHAQTLIVLSALLFGYVLQFVASFRRDRGIWRGPQPLACAANRSAGLEADGATSLPLHLGETLFVYAVPGALHVIGFAWALYVLRVADNEHLQNLVERVFIQCADRRPVAMRMVAALWAYVAVALLWLALMTGVIVWPELMMASDDVDGGAGFQRQRLLLRWVARPSEDALRAVRWSLLAVVLVHDFVQVVVITTYSIQCHLLRCHLATLREKLLQNTMDPMDWMREMGEFRKLLHHLNKRIAAPVCWFTLMNLIYTLAALIYAISRYGAWATADNTHPAAAAPALGALLTNAGNVALWLALALSPFFQAAALTLRCQSAQSCGHQVRVRPFGHQNSSAENLNSVLLYASSLRMSAKLFRMPIQGNYVSFVILCLVVGVLTTGMCLNGAPGFGGR